MATSDCDGDGKLNLLVGAPLWDDGFTDNGAVLSFAQSTFTADRSIKDATHAFVGSANDERLGTGVDADDMNDDTRPEILAGATGPAFPAGTAVMITDPCVADPCTGPFAPVCNDSNDCTNDLCDTSTGLCTYPNLADNTPCTDDTLYCTGVETCQSGVCSSSGNPCPGTECNTCQESTDSCFDPVSTPCTPDTNECTADACDGAGSCLHPNLSNGTACKDDGTWCNGPETCQSGTCTSGGNPCPGTECNTCQESLSSCFDPSGTSCSDDGNECTTDTCDGVGTCAHPAVSNGTACTDDSNECTTDTCQAGTCDHSAVANGTACSDDSNECTADTCQSGNCDHAALANGTACTDDTLYCTGVETCQSGACSSSGDPCNPVACEICNDTTDSYDNTDPDVDTICTPQDNCPNEYNPDQLDSDCGDPTYYSSGCCDGSCDGGTVPPVREGCCPNLGQGGDVCDACPATRHHNKCELNLSGGQSTGAAGGSFTLDGCISITVPAGALASDTSVTASTGVEPTTNPDVTSSPTKLKNIKSARKVVLLPDSQTFSQSVTVGFCWDDDDNDGKVDLGTCSGDASVVCSSNTYCSGLGLGNCSGAGSLQESSLGFKRDGRVFDYRGFVGAGASYHPGPQRKCGHAEQNVATAGASFCGDAALSADCTDSPGQGEASVAECCDDVNNTFAFQTCNFSEYYFGDPLGNLIPGGGSPKTDCVLELTVVNPFSEEGEFDKKGFPNFKQTCTDGDVAWDADGTADGDCEFRVGICAIIDDDRLSKNDRLLCDVSGMEVDSVQVKNPSPEGRTAAEIAAGVALRDAVAGLDPTSATIGGNRQDLVTFSPALGVPESCTEVVSVPVPLKRPGRKGKLKAVIRARTTPFGNFSAGIKDSDKLKLTCLPADGD